MNSTDAAEFLRHYAPIGTSLFECLRLARLHAWDQERVERAAEALGMP